MNAIENALRHPVSDRLGWSLIHLFWQGTVVAVLLIGVLWLLRRRSANARYVCAGLALLLLPAALAVTFAALPDSSESSSAVVRSVPREAKETPQPVAMVGDPNLESTRPVVPKKEIVVLPAAPASGRREPAGSSSNQNVNRRGANPGSDTPGSPTGTATFSTQPGAADDLAATSSPSPQNADASPPDTLQRRIATQIEPALPWIVGGWFLGLLGLSVWHVGGWIALRRLRHRGVAPVSESVRGLLGRLCERFAIRRPVELLQSSRVSVPSLMGFLKPVILLPGSVLTGLTPAQLEAVFAHELAHVRRHDYLLNLLQTAIETLLFFHPAVWWISRRIRIERENCCDDLALAVTNNRLLYAQSLTRLEELRQQTAAPRPSALTVAASGGSLLDRICRVLGAPRRRAVRSRVSSIGMTGLSGLLTIAAVLLLLLPGVMSQSPTVSANAAVAPGDDDVPSTRLGDLTVLHVVPLAEFKAGATVSLGNGAHRFDDIPEFLKGRRFTRRNGYQGILKFRVEKAQRVYFAVYGDDWGGGGNASGDWRKELVTRKQLEKQGWKEAGKLVGEHTLIDGQKTSWLVLTRNCKAGETFAIRTHKYQAPILFSAKKSSKKTRTQGGTPVNGLRLTLTADKTETTMLSDGSDAKPVKLKVAFTNVSKRPIKLNAHQLAYFHLKFDATGPDAGSIKTFTWELDVAFKPPVAGDFPVIQPGKSWSPDLKWGHLFPGDIGQPGGRIVSYQVLKPGTYKLRFTYENPNPRKLPLAKGTWTGSVVSNEFVLTVRPPAKAEKPRAAAKPIDLGKDNFKVEANPADKVAGGLYGVGSYRIAGQAPDAKTLYAWRLKKTAPDGNLQLVGRVPGYVPAGTTFRVVSFSRSGKRIAARIECRIPAVVLSIGLQTVYFRGRLPQTREQSTLPPGEYDVEVVFDDRRSIFPLRIKPMTCRLVVTSKGVPAELKKLADAAIAINPERQFARRGVSDQSPIGLDLSRLLKLTGQDKDRAKFPRAHQNFATGVNTLVKAKKTWALCSLLDHPNVDAKILAAGGLGKLADPDSVPVLLAAAKSNNYFVSGSENATLHGVYRSSLVLALQKTTGLNLAARKLKNRFDLLTGEPDFKQVDAWLKAAYPANSSTANPGKPVPAGSKRTATAAGVKQQYRFLVIQGFEKLPAGQKTEIDQLVTVGKPFNIRTKHSVSASGVLRKAKDGGLHFKGRVTMRATSAVFDVPIQLGKAATPKAFGVSSFVELFFIRFEKPKADRPHVIKEIKTAKDRGTLRDVYEKVRGGKHTKYDILNIVPGPKSKDETPSAWFNGLLKADYDLTADTEQWLLFRSKQLNDNDVEWIERIERKGNEFVITANRAIWDGAYAKNITFHNVFGLNLGKLPAGKYTVKWNIRESHFKEFDNQRWPKDEKPPKTVALKTSFNVLPSRKPAAKKAAKEQYRIRVIHRDKKPLHGPYGQMICIERVVTLGTPFDVRAERDTAAIVVTGLQRLDTFDVRAERDTAAAKGVLQRTKSGRLQFKGQIRVGYNVGTVDAPVELGKAIKPQASAGGPLEYPMFVLFERPRLGAVKVIKRASDVREKVVGRVFSKADQLLVVPGPRHAKQTLSQWFLNSLKAKNDLTTDRETWALFRSAQAGDFDQMSIEKIKRQDNTFTVTMNRVMYVGPLYRNVTFHEVHGVDLGKLPAGDYTVKWIIRLSTKDVRKDLKSSGFRWELKQDVTVRAPQKSRRAGKVVIKDVKTLPESNPFTNHSRAL